MTNMCFLEDTARQTENYSKSLKITQIIYLATGDSLRVNEKISIGETVNNLL